MTPGARLAAAIELTGLVLAERGRPADQAVSGYMRGRRYIGGGDRREISRLVYAVLRRYGQLVWWIAEVLPGAGADARKLVLAAAALGTPRMPADEIAAACDGGTHRPDPLTPEEATLLAALDHAGFADPRQDPATQANCPGWLWEKFIARFGAAAADELAALDTTAGVDLRVNTIKTDREGAQAALAEAGLTAAPTPFSPVGLRLPERAPVLGTRAWREGLIELQDEASQLAALLTDARPGMAVLDYCAGVGGKTLALAATMQNHGRLVAADIEPDRLNRAFGRCERAGASLPELVPLDAGAGADFRRGERDVFDRVLLDVPCSRTGLWRRSPEARWRLTEEELRGFVVTQREILQQVAALVKPGGRLVYATCSLLAEENEARLAGFMTEHGGFRPVPVAEVWDAAVKTPPPAGIEGDRWLTLTPARHGTDGFFVGILERAE
jgi:16S rRNA (cytosine967-C5)-methyltransferase